MAKRNELSWRGMLAHPLTVAILIYVPLLMTNADLGARLWLLEPAAWASSDASVDEVPDDLSEAEVLQWEVQRLQEKNALLVESNHLLREAYPQLADFEKAYGSLVQDITPARIVLTPGDSSPWRQGLYINVGSSDGIEVGFPVTQGRTLVGKVTSVSANTSVVTLISDFKFRTPVSILPSEAQAPRVPIKGELAEGEHPLLEPTYAQETRGILRGNGSDEVRLPRIPLDDVAVDAKVQKGDVVVTNDAAGAFPAGLLVGYVESVQNQNDFLSLRVKSAMNLQLSDVLLVIPHAPPSLDESVRTLAGDRHLDKKKRG